MSVFLRTHQNWRRTGADAGDVAARPGSAHGRWFWLADPNSGCTARAAVRRAKRRPPPSHDAPRSLACVESIRPSRRRLPASLWLPLSVFFLSHQPACTHPINSSITRHPTPTFGRVTPPLFSSPLSIVPRFLARYRAASGDARPAPVPELACTIFFDGSGGDACGCGGGSQLARRIVLSEAVVIYRCDACLPVFQFCLREHGPPSIVLPPSSSCDTTADDTTAGTARCAHEDASRDRAGARRAEPPRELRGRLGRPLRCPLAAAAPRGPARAGGLRVRRGLCLGRAPYLDAQKDVRH